MNTLSKSVLLFLLNWLDAQLTLVWVRAGLATEGNALMSYLLDIGDGTFLVAKIVIGLFAAWVFWQWSHVRMARRGVGIALGVYTFIMLVHFATGAAALGWQAPEHVLSIVTSASNAVLMLF